MIYARSVRPVVQLAGAFVGVTHGAIVRALDYAASAVLRRI